MQKKGIFEIRSAYKSPFIHFLDKLLVQARSVSRDKKAVTCLQDEINGFYHSMKRYKDIYIFTEPKEI